MTNSLDERAMNRFAVALYAMTMVESDGTSRTNPRRMMFMCGQAGQEADLAEATREVGMDVVALGFDPGREREGPSNIAVYEQRDGTLNAWTDCSAWTQDDRGPLLIVSRRRNVCFCHDGTSLLVFEDWPSDRSADGFRVARPLLRRAALKVPADLPSRRIL